MKARRASAGRSGGWLLVLVALLLAGPAQPDLLVTSDRLSPASPNAVLRYAEGTGAFLGALVPPNSGGLNQPGDMVFGTDGKLYVISSLTSSVLRYDPQTGAFLGTFIAANSGGLFGPRSLELGFDGNLYVSAENAVLRYNGETGAFIDRFVTAGSGGLAEAWGLVFGPDGKLYVVSGETNSILRYNGQTGAFTDAFVASASGGLRGPADLVFGPDGNLYVTSLVSHAVLRYNGDTGAFIDGFVTPGSGGLRAPVSLAFGPDGNLYAASRDTSSVLRYNGQTGAFIDTFIPELRGGMVLPWGLLFTPPGAGGGTDRRIIVDGPFIGEQLFPTGTDVTATENPNTGAQGQLLPRPSGQGQRFQGTLRNFPGQRPVAANARVVSDGETTLTVLALSAAIMNNLAAFDATSGIGAPGLEAREQLDNGLFQLASATRAVDDAVASHRIRVAVGRSLRALIARATTADRRALALSNRLPANPTRSQLNGLRTAIQVAQKFKRAALLAVLAARA